MNRSYLLAFSTIVLVSSLVGCGSSGPQGSIEGKISLKGSPVPEGSKVMFVGDGRAASAVVAADGTYRVEEAPIGKYKVAVTAPTVPMSPEEQMKAAMAKKGKKGAGDSTFPNKYTSLDQSGEEIEVKEGKNDYSLDMK